MNFGIKLADGTFFEGSVGKSGNRIELTISKEDAATHMLDLMDPVKTKWIGYYINQLIAEYKNYEFVYMQRDRMDGKIDVWLEQKGENQNEENGNSEKTGTEESPRQDEDQGNNS